MWLSCVSFWLVQLKYIRNSSLKIFLFPCSESPKNYKVPPAETFLACAPKPIRSALIVRNSCCLRPTHSISGLMCPSIYPGPQRRRGPFCCVCPLENHNVMLGKHSKHCHLFTRRSVKVPSAAVGPEGECRGGGPLRVPDWGGPDPCHYLGERQSSRPAGGQVRRWVSCFLVSEVKSVSEGAVRCGFRLFPWGWSNTRDVLSATQ